MNEEDQKTVPQPAKHLTNFCSIAQENEVLFDVQSSIPKFDTSLPTRSPSAKSSSSSSNGDTQGTTLISLPKTLETSNSKKRSSHSVDDTAEDILEQICSQMNTLSTQDSNDDKIAAFMSVLACAHAEAAFFLESALWSVEAAVSLWLESGVGAGSSSSMAFSMENNKRFRRMNDDDDRVNPYYNRQLIIEGLPSTWTAWVSTVSGEVYFKHTGTGHTQSNVPPRFADSNQKSNKNGNNVNKHDYLDSDNMQDRDDDGELEEEEHHLSMGKSLSAASRLRNSDKYSASADSCDVESGGDVGDSESLDGMQGTINLDRDTVEGLGGLGEGDDDVSVSSSGQTNSNNSINSSSIQPMGLANGLTDGQTNGSTDGATRSTSANNLDIYNDLDSSNNNDRNRMF